MQPSANGRTQDWWPCPYCRAVNSLRATTCAVCGSQLRDADDDLFAPVGTAGPPMVTVEPPAPRNGTAHEADRSTTSDTAVPSGAVAPPPMPPVGPSGWTGPQAPGTPAPASPVTAPAPPVEMPAAGPAPAGGDVVDDVAPGELVVASRLSPELRRAVALPLSVIGSLMTPQEAVVAVVAGTTLGQVAVVVLSEDRILIVNGRQDGPVIDVFDLGPHLTVRCRHDGEVAALTLFDDRHLVTVDGIRDVDVAIDLARRVHRRR